MMQYLLTEEEFNDLHEGHANEIFVIKERLQKACTLAAEHTPVKLPWAEDDDPVPWGCVRVNDHTSYCDECPVRKICPYEGKRYSK